MGYSIHIGNARLEHDDESLAAWYSVERTTNPAAPRWPNPVDGGCMGIDISEDTNGRHPSYTGMSRWAEEVGLKELFFGADGRGGLLNPHPGCQRIDKDMLAQVTAARERWERTHSGTVPGWRDGEDSDLAKLIWYEWWMKWALENCALPAIENG